MCDVSNPDFHLLFRNFTRRPAIFIQRKYFSRFGNSVAYFGGVINKSSAYKAKDDTHVLIPSVMRSASTRTQNEKKRERECSG